MANYWKIEVVPEAMRDFYALDTTLRTRIRECLRRAVACERPPAHALAGKPGWYSLHMGKYCIVYMPHHDGSVHIMLITAVGLHDEVYRELARRYDKYGR